MRIRLPILCGLVSVGLAYAQAGNPIKLTVAEDPKNPGSTLTVLENASKAALTAVTLVGAGQGSRSFDSATRLGIASEVKPGDKYTIGVPGVYPPGQIQLAATILADGETFGDPAQIEAILERRRATLKALPIVIKHFPTRAPSGGAAAHFPTGSQHPWVNPMPSPDEDVVQEFPTETTNPALTARDRPHATIEEEMQHSPAGPPPIQLMAPLLASQSEEIRGVRDNAVAAAIMNVNRTVQRSALGMTSDSSSEILKNLAAMLRAWEEDLRRSLPKL